MNKIALKSNKHIKSATFYATKCKDKVFADRMISSYKDQASSAIKSIINMSRAVEEVDKRYRDDQINSDDLNYFCMSVGLKKRSSQFRKFVCIGRHADKFEKYIENMPSAITVLYEITTLDAEIFETLIENNYISQNTTLSQLKKLAEKPPKKKRSSKSSLESIAIEFDIHSISEKSKQDLTSVMRIIKKNDSFVLRMPSDNEFSDYLLKAINDEEVIDVEVKTI